MFVLQYQVMSFALWWMEGRLCTTREGGARELVDVPNLSVSQLSLLLWCEMNVTTTETPQTSHYHKPSDPLVLKHTSLVVGEIILSFSFSPERLVVAERCGCQTFFSCATIQLLQ